MDMCEAIIKQPGAATSSPLKIRYVVSFKNNIVAESSPIILDIQEDLNLKREELCKRSSMPLLEKAKAETYSHLQKIFKYNFVSQG